MPSMQLAQSCAVLARQQRAVGNKPVQDFNAANFRAAAISTGDTYANPVLPQVY